MQSLVAPPLTLEPLVADHAESMFAVLSDPRIYEHLDYGPPTSIEELRQVYARREARCSPDGKQQWLNWVLRLDSADASEFTGYVQATIEPDNLAWIAYVLAPSYWGEGHAGRACMVMMDHLRTHYGVSRFAATVEAGNERSIALLTRLGLRLAGEAEVLQHSLTHSERLFVRQD